MKIRMNSGRNDGDLVLYAVPHGNPVSMCGRVTATEHVST